MLKVRGVGDGKQIKKVVREHDFLRFSLSRERGRELFDYKLDVGYFVPPDVDAFVPPDVGIFVAPDVGAFIAPVALFTHFNIEFGVGSASASPFTDIQVMICCLHAFIATLFVGVELDGAVLEV